MRSVVLFWYWNLHEMRLLIPASACTSSWATTYFSREPTRQGDRVLEMMTVTISQAGFSNRA